MGDRNVAAGHEEIGEILRIKAAVRNAIGSYRGEMALGEPFVARIDGSIVLSGEMLVDVP